MTDILLKPGDTAEWLGKELRGFISDVVTDEAKRQIELGNDPALLSVDNRPTQVTDTMLRGFVAGKRVADTSRMKAIVTLTFADIDTIYDAVDYAYNRIKAIMRKKTGAGIESIYFWCNDPQKKRSMRVESLEQVRAWLNGQSDPLTSIHILGPTVPYRRALIYNPKGKQYTALERASSSSVRNKIAATKGNIEASVGRTGVKFRVAQAFYKAVAAATMRRYRNTYVVYSYIRSREPLTHGANIPRLWVGLTRGKRTRRRI